MKAVALTRYLPIDDPESLVDIELDTPTPGAHDLLVAVPWFAVPLPAAVPDFSFDPGLLVAFLLNIIVPKDDTVPDDD